MKMLNERARRHLDGTTGSAPRPNVGVPQVSYRGATCQKVRA